MSDPTPKPIRRARGRFTQLVVGILVGVLLAGTIPAGADSNAETKAVDISALA